MGDDHDDFQMTIDCARCPVKLCEGLVVVPASVIQLLHILCLAFSPVFQVAVIQGLALVEMLDLCHQFADLQLLIKCTHQPEKYH